MAAVEGEAVALADGVVPVRLDLVDVVGDEAGAVGAGGVREGWFQGFLVFVAFVDGC